jgi:SSS family solute:Na+ symporter
LNVGGLDLAILIGYMAGMVALGSWLGRGARDVAEYAVGSRDLPWWLILFSILATETSSVTFLSIPGFAYERNFTWLQIAFGFLLGCFVVAAILLPEYFRGSLFTAYEVRGPSSTVRRRHSAGRVGIVPGHPQPG